MKNNNLHRFHDTTPLHSTKETEHLIARVTREDRGMYDVLCSARQKTCRARLAGALRYGAQSKQELPAVGDWVDVRQDADAFTITRVYERKSVLLRQAAGERVEAQVIASNIDTVFIVTSMNQEFEPRRLERYVLAIWESGAQAVLVLNKSDLADDPEDFVDRARAVSAGARVVSVSAIDGDLSALDEWLGPKQTIAFVGSSGVGKSTIINKLAGHDLQATRSIRGDDDEGRHTTTARHLITLSNDRGVLIDTPGMREFQLWSNEQDIGALFEDIEELATFCRFRDCKHSGEPGCAIEEAIALGELDPGRLASWSKLQREMSWQARRQDVAKQRADARQFAKMVKRTINQSSSKKHR